MHIKELPVSSIWEPNIHTYPVTSSFQLRGTIYSVRNYSKKKNRNLFFVNMFSAFSQRFDQKLQLSYVHRELLKKPRSQRRKNPSIILPADELFSTVNVAFVPSPESLLEDSIVWAGVTVFVSRFGEDLSD